MVEKTDGAPKADDGAKPPRTTMRAGVYLVFERAGKILIDRHTHTGYRDGEFGLPGGHIDSGEPASGAAIRIANEQVGLRLRLAELRLAHVMHRSGKSGTNTDNIDFYFLVLNFPGEAKDTMPQKFDSMEWVTWNALPPNTIAEVRYALECIKEDKIYSEFDFIN